MPEPSATLLTEALGRLAGSLDGLPLVTSKAAPGAFPASTAGRQAARFCQDQGLVRGFRRPPAARDSVERFTVTPSGIHWLSQQAAARPALDGLAAALRERSSHLENVQQQLHEQQQALSTLRQLIDDWLRREREQSGDGVALLQAETEILAQLEAWHERHPLKDCPLPQLYGRINERLPNVSVGQFHDACRRLLERGRIYLHPWTGPLFEMPDPAIALLSGHEIAYYASLKV